MRAHQVFRLAIAFAAILLAGLAHAQVLNNEVEFTGDIKTVAPDGEGGGALFVEIDGFDLRVIVNPKTVVWDSDRDPMPFEKLVMGASVTVTGKFSSSGVLATKVELSESQDPNTFEVSGHITNIQSTVVSLLGLSIETSGVADRPELKIGTWVHIEGTIDPEGDWSATAIKIVNPGKRKGQVAFEGIVAEDYAAPVLKVSVAGTSDNVTNVLVTPATRISGDLVKGAHVSVAGKFKNFDIEAKSIEVLGPFQVKPDEKKLKVGETATFTIKLREPAPAGGVDFTLVADPAARVGIDPAVRIDAGKDTADFTVEANEQGQATVTVTALNTSVPVLVKIGGISDEENERPEGDVRIKFAPDHVRMGLGDTREVVLLVQPPQEQPVTLKVADGKEGPVPDTALKVSESRELGSGTAQRKVAVVSGTTPGSYKVTATLGSALAELLVEVEEKTHGKKD